MATKRISQLAQTATEADLKAGNYFALDGADGTKRLPAEAVAKAESINYTTMKSSYVPVEYTTARGFVYGNEGGVISYGDEVTYTHSIVDVNEGEEYFIQNRTGRGAVGDYPMVCVIDDDGTIIKILAKASPRKDYLTPECVGVKIPAGATKMVICTFSNRSAILRRLFIYRGESTSIFNGFAQNVDIDKTIDYVEDKLVYSVNRLNLDGLLADKYVDDYGGISDYTGWSCTDYLRVEPGKNYFLGKAGTAVANVYYATYDRQKKFIRATTSGSGNHLINVDADAYFVRISQRSAYFEAASSYMLLPEELYGSEPMFMPYSEDLKYAPIAEHDNKIEEIVESLSTKSLIALTIESLKRYIVYGGKVAERADSGTFRTAVFQCGAGDVLYYSGVHYNYAGQFSIIFANDLEDVLATYFGNAASDESSATTETDAKVVAPAGTTKVYVQSYRVNPTLKKDAIVDVVSEFERVDGEISKVQPDYNNVVRSIQRIGAGYGQHNSVLAFKKAYKAGWRIITTDLLFTSDGVPVCCHDHYLNQHENVVYDANGVKVPTTNPVYIKDNTWATLSTYDFGKDYGAEFVGGKLPRLDEVCDLCKRLGIELYIEVKEMDTQEQANAAAKIVRNHGISKQTSWACGTTTQCQMVLNAIPDARVGTMPSTLTTSIIDGLIALKNEKNKVFIFGWDTTQLTESIVSRLFDNNIEFEMGTPSTAQAIIDYYNQGEVYKYCTGIQCNTIIAGKVVYDNFMGG